MASEKAGQAQQAANQAGTRVTSLAGTVENLDNYKQVSDTTVRFAFDKAVLTKAGQAELDQLPGKFKARSTTSFRWKATPIPPVPLTITIS